MNHSRRGVALIINNIEVSGFKKREGAKKDDNRLVSTLSKLGFEINMNTDATAEEMKWLLKEASDSNNHLDVDCFLCVIMSHGKKMSNGQLGVLGTDGIPIDVMHEAKNLFSNIFCSALRNKPKLFFIDACWGNEKIPLTDPLNPSINDTMKKGENLLARNSDVSSNGGVDIDLLPAISDFLFSFATLPDYMSLRNNAKGNWFIQALCSALDKDGYTKTLSAILQDIRIQLKKMTIPDFGQMSFDFNILLNDVIFESGFRRIVSQSLNGTILVWNVETGVCEKELRNQWLPTLIQPTFVSESTDKLIRVWNASTGECVRTLVGHRNMITYFSSHESTQMLSSGSADGTIRIWNINTGICLQNQLKFLLCARE